METQTQNSSLPSNREQGRNLEMLFFSKQISISSFCMALLIFPLIFMVSCQQSIYAPEIQKDSFSTLTLMLYIGDASAEESAFDFMKRLEKAPIPWRINVFALASFSTKNGDPWDATRLYQIHYDSADSEHDLVSQQLALPDLALTLEGDTVLEMTAPDTLEKFIDFSQRESVTDHYGLVVITDSFLGGDVIGMRYSEFSSVLKGKKLDFVGLEGSGGGNVELLYELRDTEAWVAASPVKHDSWDYEAFFKGIQGYEGKEKFLSALSSTASSSNALLVYAPEEIDLLISELDELINAFTSQGLLSTEKKIEDLKKLFLGFDFYNDESRRYVEIHSLYEGLKNAHPQLSSELEKLRKAFDQVVVSESESPRMTIYLCDGDSNNGYGTLGDAYRSDGTDEKAGSVVGVSQWYGNRESHSGFLYNLWESTVVIYREGKLTLMVYIDADNASAPMADMTLNAMEAAQYGEDVNVVALVDMGEGNGGIWDNSRLYEIAHDTGGINRSLVSIQRPSVELGLPSTGSSPLDMSSKETLKAFISFVKLHYRSDDYGLVMVAKDFSGGKLHAHDDTGGMSYKDFAWAIEDGRPEFVGLAGSAGANVALMYELKDSGAWVAASWGGQKGWDFQALLQNYSNYTDRKGFLDHLKNNATDAGDISLYAPENMGSLVSSLDELAKVVWREVSNAEKQSELRELLLGLTAHDFARHRHVEISSLLEGFKASHPQLTAEIQQVETDLLSIDVHSTTAHPMTIYLCDGDSDTGYGTLGDAYRSDGTDEKAGSVVGVSQWYGNRESHSGFLYHLWESTVGVYREGKLTLMVYMAADNDLASTADIDLNEMEAADYGEDVHVVALVDMGEGNSGLWENGRLYEIVSDKDGMNHSLVSIQRPSIELGLPEAGSAPLDMSSETTLSTFIKYVKKHYNSNDYGLVVWGHGSGWRNGSLHSRALGVDGERMMPTAAFARGIANHKLGFNLSFVAFDLCFGSNFEMAWEIRNHTPYMAGSQGLIPASGWDYSQAFNIGNSYVDVKGFLNHINANLKNTIENFWIYDLSKVEPVKTAFDALVVEWEAAIDSTSTQASWQKFLISEVVGDGDAGSSDTRGIWNVDMFDMVEKLTSQSYISHTVGLVSTFNTQFDALIEDGYGNDYNGVSLYLCDTDDRMDPALVSVDYFKGSTGADIPDFVLKSPWAPDATSETGFLYKLWYTRWGP